MASRFRRPTPPTALQLLWFVAVALIGLATPGNGSTLAAQNKETPQADEKPSASIRGLAPKKQKLLDAAVRDEMKRQKLVGVAVGVIRRGKLVHVQAYGWADREAERRMETTTVVNWASNSKPVAAVIAAQLVREGLLDLDADIRTYLPDFPDKGHPITTRQLLCHQSGFPHYENGRIIPGRPLASPFPVAGPAAAGESGDGTGQSSPDHTGSTGKAESLPEWDPAVSVARFVDSPLIHVPGTHEDYSSYAYVLLSAVLQAAGKESLHDQIARRIVNPLQLQSFQLDLPLSPNQQNRQADWAKGYFQSDDGKVVATPDEAHYWKHAAGGYKSNVVDFGQWAAGLLGSDLLDESAKQKFWVRQPLGSEKPGRFGLGFEVSGSGNRRRISHGGSQGECRTRLVVEPATGSGVVVMSNCNHADPSRLADVIEAALR